MCDRLSIQCIIPPYINDKLAQSTNPTVRARAIANIRAAATLRTQRVMSQAMPGLMVDEPADHEMREQGAARHDLGQRQIDARSLADLLAGSAGNAGANVPQHPEAGRDVIQDLGDVLADLRLGAAADRQVILKSGWPNS